MQGNARGVDMAMTRFAARVSLSGPPNAQVTDQIISPVPSVSGFTATRRREKTSHRCHFSIHQDHGKSRRFDAALAPRHARCFSLWEEETPVLDRSDLDFGSGHDSHQKYAYNASHPRIAAPTCPRACCQAARSTPAALRFRVQIPG